VRPRPAPRRERNAPRRAADRPLPRRFYDRPAAEVARDLLGAILVRRLGRRRIAGRLVETEAYVTGDPASHAFRGRTERNRSMFAGPGHLYVFRIHQVCCLNAVTRPGEAVLLRAAEPMAPGGGSMSGPGRLARAFGVTRAEDGTDLLDGPVRILPGPTGPARIVAGPRVGISRARERPLRFFLYGHPAVSRPRGNAPTRARRA